MDFKYLAEKYEVEIEAWHLFYESFIEYDNALKVGNGVLVTMMSELIKAKIVNPNNEKIKSTEERIKTLFSCLEKLNGLNNKCNNLQIKLKKTVATKLEMDIENEILKAEILALKASFNDN